MAEMSREEVLARYRHLRAISTRHHTEAMNFVSRPALLEQARRLGLAVGGTAVGSVLYIYAVTTAGAARAVILNSTSPLMVVPLSMYFLKERPTPAVVLGTAFCLAGTLMVIALG